MARIGIFGGSFNPPHRGHILALQEFQEKLGLDQIFVIPAAQPPHKHLSSNSPDADTRLLLTQLACFGMPCVKVSDMELRRSGASYTSDTVSELRRRFPADELFLLMGTDMFYSFEMWHDPEQITRQVTLVVAHRSEDDAMQLASKREKLQARFSAQIIMLENAYVPISSTSARAFLAFGYGEDYLAPMVYEEIRRRRLYYVGHDLRQLPFDELARVSLSLHDAKRMAHAAGCSATARELALRYGADADAAARAGILHDITKALKPEEQLNLCEKCGILYSNFEQRNAKLLHAKTGAAIAESVFGEDAEVCDAIRWHTTGKPDMTQLEKIIYLADYMEPNRDFPGVERLREAAKSSLDSAMVLGLEMTISQLSEKGREVDANSRAALDFYKERMTET